MTEKKPLKMEEWPLERLIGYARNPRKNDDVVDRMCTAIREFGFRIPIVAKSDGTVVDGHLRLKAAKKLHLKTVPVVLADELTPTQVKAFRLLVNQSANWADWDIELLKLEINDLKEQGYDIDNIGFDESLLASLEDIDIESFFTQPTTHSQHKPKEELFICPHCHKKFNREEMEQGEPNVREERQ